MNIGDRVRLLSGREEGFITQIIDKQQIEVEIDEGFRIPVLRSEVAIVQKDEERYFKDAKPAQIEPIAPPSPTVLAQSRAIGEGVFLAFAPFNDKLLNLYIINHTPHELLFTFGEQQDQNFFGIQAGKIESQKLQKVHVLPLEDFKNWKPIYAQVIFFKQTLHEPQLPLHFLLTFNTSFFKTKRIAPLLHKEAFLYSLDSRYKLPDPIETPPLRPVEAEKLKEIMMERKTVFEKAFEIERPAREIDLHIEALTPHYDIMTSEAILKMQIEHFEHIFDRAIASGMEKITFIHGVGAGILRAEIQKRVSRNPYVKYYEDSQRDKFGYGATTITFK
ncbi:Smr/MutS family protein [Hugenholtzia roseola]|uniref:Smr/MutS family protein n=1 Tax=Hugenholtzia roseola TaxID=1002 RepID=UPI00047DF1B3|nr:DUF2027 domain-containing protein [Hugenholtzia roseola]